GTPTHSAVVDFLNSEEVPDLFVSSGSLMWGDDPEARPWTFGWQPDYEIEGKIIAQYVAQNFPDAKVGLFVQDDDFGRDGEKGARHYLENQIVDVERYTPGNTDVAPQIAALQAAGADLVIGFNVPSYTALSQLQSLRLNYKPQWIYSNVGSDPTLVGSLLARFSEGAVTDAGLLEGVLTTEYLPGVDTPDNPWMQLFQRVWDANGGDGELTNYHVYGMAEAYTFVQALQAADAAVLPSHYEPFGIVALEAAATGTPLVTSNVGGLGEAVINGQTGMSFAPRDVVGLAAAVRAVLDDPEAAQRRAIAARERLSADFDWHTVAAETSQVYLAAKRAEREPHPRRPIVEHALPER
ncbi:MAG: ABC transporter substrate-binding protein, partial [Actinomycetes bacterium]